MNEETTIRYADTIKFAALKMESKLGHVLLNVSLHVEDDGVRVTVPIYSPRKDETVVSIITTQDGRVRVYKTLQAAKNALHKAGITHYSFVRDGKECWS